MFYTAERKVTTICCLTLPVAMPFISGICTRGPETCPLSVESPLEQKLLMPLIKGIVTVVVSCAWLNPFLDHVQSDALADNRNAEPVPQAFRAVVSRNRDR
jgi:hypothetical protein